MAVDMARAAALKTLYEILENGAYSNIALNKQLEASELKELDRAFATELVYGTIKWKLTLDWIIKQFSSIKPGKISPWIMNILRLGIYQLLYMDRIPVSAACNESVTLAKRYGHSGSSGFVNAVLRNVARSRDNLRYPDRKNEPVKYLSVKYSYPEWMAERFLKLYGEEFTENLLSSGNAVPDLTVRVNTLKISREELIEALKKEGVEASPGKYVNEAVVLINPSSLVKLDAFKKGLFQVQDESSMLAGRILDPKPGELVIDACSAPGGKATHMAQLMENKGLVLARDIHEHKIRLIDEAAQRLGINIIKTEIFDASGKDVKNNMKADRVLLDAPCSGLGIIRKKPDIKWTRTADEAGQLPELQNRLMEAASGCVKPGGVLVYSTCTILPEENQMVVEKFLKNNAEFELDDITGLIPGELHGYIENKGFLQLFPNRDGIDGFFMARIRRRS